MIECGTWGALGGNVTRSAFNEAWEHPAADSAAGVAVELRAYHYRVHSHHNEHWTESDRFDNTSITTNWSR